MNTGPVSFISAIDMTAQVGRIVLNTCVSKIMLLQSTLQQISLLERCRGGGARHPCIIQRSFLFNADKPTDKKVLV